TAWIQGDERRGIAFGVGTYRLRVILPDTPDQLALRTSRVRTAAVIMVDGARVHTLGQVGTDRQSSGAVWRTDIVRLPAAGDGTLELVVQVSNFHDRGGGIQEALILGSEDRIRADWLRRIVWELLAFGILGAAGFYHVIIFSMRRHDTTPLIFGGASIWLAIRVLVVGQTLITTFFPGLPFGVHLDLVHISGSIPIALMILFMEHLFREERVRIVGLVLVAVNLAYTLFVIAAPTWVYVTILPYYQIAMLASGVYIIAVVVRAIVHRRRASVPFGLTFAVLFAASLNDMLSDRFLFGTPFLSQYAMLFVVFAQAVLLARLFVLALRESEQHAAFLQRVNDAMERFVPREFLHFLNRETVTDVQLGDHVSVDMTVMFVDIRSFTKRVDAMEPAETFSFLNDYLAAVGPIIRRNGGFVDKYLGDGIMALFSESPESAVKAGVTILKVLRRFNERIIERGQDEVRIGIGVHTGELMLGTIGETRRIDSTVISPVVNVAKRIEEQTKELGVSFAISGAVAEHIEDRSAYRLADRGAITLRGVSEPVEILQVEPKEQ
ncbi:MAG: adenylate/guanylate cyclase domain-containing protein, partial [Spirochaetaceae bacterium]|nr:adenylate/guanylate cyclase domain-containing protein [Spirochaetaceae bacterium]